MSISIDLTGKTALITGGTRGIGKAIADKFIQAGAFTIITGTKQSEVDQLNNSIIAGKISYMQLDLSDKESTLAFLSEIRALPKIDILINNAGINRINLNTETTLEDYDLLNDINLKGPYLICREVSRIMKNNKYGRIINISSIWSSVTRSGRSLYSTTKCGLVGLTKTLSVELASYDILVNAVGPGFTLTELTMSTNTQEEIANMSDIIPIKRFAEPVEIANLVLFLGSDLNTYITGQNMIIDGGYTNV